MILTYSHIDKETVKKKNALLLKYRHSLGNTCNSYSPIYFDEITKEYFIILKNEHIHVYGLKTFKPIDRTEYFNKLNDLEK